MLDLAAAIGEGDAIEFVLYRGFTFSGGADDVRILSCKILRGLLFTDDGGSDCGSSRSLLLRLRLRLGLLRLLLLLGGIGLGFEEQLIAEEDGDDQSHNGEHGLEVAAAAAATADARGLIRIAKFCQVITSCSH